MNNAELFLTPQPVAATGVGITQLSLAMAVNVLDYDVADLTLSLLALSATTAPTADVEIWTGMQNDTLDGWYKAANWPQQQSASATGLKLSVTAMQKYIIWRVVLGAGSGTPSCVFFIAGVLRQT